MSPGLAAFGTMIGKCVTAATDSDALSCTPCTSFPCGPIASSDGLVKAYCGQTTNANKPSITSCYVGTFSATSSANTVVQTSCGTGTFEFCQVFNTTNIVRHILIVNIHILFYI